MIETGRKSFHVVENARVIGIYGWWHGARIAEACSKGEMIVEAMPEWKERFLELYHRIKKIVA